MSDIPDIKNASSLAPLYSLKHHKIVDEQPILKLLDDTIALLFIKYQTEFEITAILHKRVGKNSIMTKLTSNIPHTGKYILSHLFLCLRSEFSGLNAAFPAHAKVIFLFYCTEAYHNMKQNNK